MKSLESIKQKFVDDALVNRKPMEFAKVGSNGFFAFDLTDKSCGDVLHTLKFENIRFRQPIQQTVTTVQSRRNKCMDETLRGGFIQLLSDSSNLPDSVVCSFTDAVDMVSHPESRIEDNSEIAHLLFWRDISLNNFHKAK